MRILFASSEAFPLIKTGGLGDISASLPAALTQRGQDVRLVLPGYPVAQERLLHPRRIPGPRQASWSLIEGILPGVSPAVTVWLVDWPVHFQRSGDPYRTPEGQDWPDNAERFAAFARVIAALGAGQAGVDWVPDLLHLNDWQTGLVPVYALEHAHRPPTLFTIHNLAYQGIFPGSTRFALGIPAHLWQMQGLEYHGQLSFMKAGLTLSNIITTVSPTYAQEIQQDEPGMGLAGILRQRAHDLHGILNGVDYREWNPANDPHLPHAYDADHPQGKRQIKAHLQQELQLPERDDLPLLGYVGRMVDQKGIDLLLEACTPLLRDGRVQLVIVGSGQKNHEKAALALQTAYPEACRTLIAYNEGLAHRVEAGADAFLMPSRFEPCGMNQLYSLRYGTPPIVHATGGLQDTVVDTTAATLASGTATGFTFRPATAQALLATIERALELFQQPGQAQWQDLMRTGMTRDFGWERSAQQYLELYQTLQAYPSIYPSTSSSSAASAY